MALSQQWPLICNKFFSYFQISVQYTKQHNLNLPPVTPPPPLWKSSGCGENSALFFSLKVFFSNSDLVHGPNAAPVAAKIRRQMALQTFYQKSASKLQLSVLCQLSFLFLPGSPKAPLDMSKWGLKKSLFISNMCAGFFTERVYFSPDDCWKRI